MAFQYLVRVGRSYHQLGDAQLGEPVSWLVHARRRERGTRWPKLSCFHQVLLALVHLRKNETPPQLAAGFGISTAIAWRYVDETLEALAS